MGEQGERKRGRPEQQLIPGLPDDVVLNRIAPKISWKSLYSLVWVSQSWRQAIRSRAVYNLRKTYGVIQSLVVAPVQCQLKNGKYQGIYDVESQNVYLFPPPGASRLQRELWPMVLCRPHSGEFIYSVFQQAWIYAGEVSTANGIVFLDGKLYSIQESQGTRVSQDESKAGIQTVEEVLVLDIRACEWEWKCCHRGEPCRKEIRLFDNMFQGRTDLLATSQGKIYSFHICIGCIHGKVFDPKYNMWSEIKDRPRDRPMHFPHRMDSYDTCLASSQVAVLDKEIYVTESGPRSRIRSMSALTGTMLVFNSETERWRRITSTQPDIAAGVGIRRRFMHMADCVSVIVIGGKLYQFCNLAVSVHDPETNSWTTVQLTNSKEFIADRIGDDPDVETVERYGNEVVAMLKVRKRSGVLCGRKRRFCKSVGFGDDTELKWENVPDFGLKNSLHDNSKRLALLHVEL